MLLPPLNQEKDRPMTMTKDQALNDAITMLEAIANGKTYDAAEYMANLKAMKEAHEPATGFDAIPAEWDDFTKNEVFDLICDILGDCNRRDTVAMVTENWTQADWENQLADMNDDE